MDRILIVEDDIELNKGLCRALKAEDRQVIPAASLKAAREELMLGTVSIVLLDENLPDGNGLELLKEIKGGLEDIPVIMITANDTDLDIVEGLEQGADDYITKPFSLSVLRARVNTQLRKAQTAKVSAAETESEVYTSGRYCFDFDRMVFSVENMPVELSKTEQKLLRILVRNRGITITRNVLIDRIWTDGADYVDENALSVTVKRLRDKLGAGEYIKTVYGIGYSWQDNFKGEK